MLNPPTDQIIQVTQIIILIAKAGCKPLFSCNVPECHPASQNERFLCTQLFPPGENGGAPVKQRQTEGARLKPNAWPGQKKTVPAFSIWTVKLFKHTEHSLLHLTKNWTVHKHTCTDALMLRKLEWDHRNFSYTFRATLDRNRSKSYQHLLPMDMNIKEYFYRSIQNWTARVLLLPLLPVWKS